MLTPSHHTIHPVFHSFTLFRTVYETIGLGFETPEALYEKKHYRYKFKASKYCWTFNQCNQCFQVDRIHASVVHLEPSNSSARQQREEGGGGGDQRFSLDMREGRRSFETKVEYDDDDDRLIRTQTALNATPMCSKLQLTVISEGP